MIKRYASALVVVFALAFGISVSAQKPANAPAGSTAQCSDGTFSTAKTEKGACSRHGGVKTWFGGEEKKAPAAKKAPAEKNSAEKNSAEKKSAEKKSPEKKAPAETKAAPPPPPPARTAPTAATEGVPKTAAPKAAAKTSTKAQTVAPPAGTPADATAKCKDGTYSFAKTHSGACSRHGGVAEWYK